MWACAQLAKERLEHADFDRASYEALHSSLSDEIDDGPFVEPSAVLRALTRAIYSAMQSLCGCFRCSAAFVLAQLGALCRLLYFR